jgi:hypothetical protein
MAMAAECTRMEYELNEAKARINRLEETGDALMEIVEGARSERWNVNGFRLKDTPEWVQFYVSFRKAKRSKRKEAKP